MPNEDLDSSMTPGNAELDALEHLAQRLVGAGRVWEAQDRLTRGMLAEALRRTAGNYAHAAQLLGVKRQAVQQMVSRFDLEAWTTRLRGESKPKRRVASRLLTRPSPGASPAERET